MLSYQHAYHAGNFADVIKHVVLSRILHYLTLKEKPFLYLDTHSGKGLYDLKSFEALKTNEANNGIFKLWQHRQKLPSVFSNFIEILETLNPDQVLRHYPGSPLIAQSLTRTTDRVVCFEKHPREFRTLETLPKNGKRVFYYEGDGPSKLSAFFPPPEKRGILFIDPPYEQEEEYRKIPKTIAEAYQRFSTGVICLWYPIIDKHLHQKLLADLHKIAPKNTLTIEFFLSRELTKGMKAMGLWIVNPPHVLAEEINTACAYLRQIFDTKTAFYDLKTA